MEIQELHDLISSFTKDIEFQYNGVNGLIMPLAQNENITLCYGDDDVVLKTTDEVMQHPMFDGKSLNEICEFVSFI